MIGAIQCSLRLTTDRYLERVLFLEIQMSHISCSILNSSVIVLMALLTVPESVGAGVPDALEQFEVAVQSDHPPLIFLRLPRMENIVDIASGDSDTKNTFATSATYLAQTELSLGIVKSLLHPTSWERYQRRFDPIFSEAGPKWKPYRQAVEKGSLDFPALLIGVSEIVEICRHLNDKVRVKSVKLDLRLETLRFRIPSRLEWQFAARGVTALEDRDEVEHFSQWVDYAKIENLEGDILTVQGDLGDTPDVAAVVSQKNLLDLVDRAQAANNKRGYQVLGKILQGSLGFEPNIGKGSESGVRPIIDTSPAPWGFHRMQGNLAEWVLTATDLPTIDKLWKQLLEADDLATVSDEEFGIVMGGGFISLIPHVGHWAKYSIAGGDPVDPLSLVPKPYKVGECLAEGGEAIYDTNGGVRLLLNRTMADDWFVALRSDTFLERSNDPLEQNTEHILEVVKDICSSKDRNTYVDMIEFYRELTLGIEHVSLEKWQEMLNKLKSAEKKYANSEQTSNTTLNAALAAFEGFGIAEETTADKSGGSGVSFFTISRELAMMDVESPAKK